jgi:serine/threonine protein kinase
MQYVHDYDIIHRDVAARNFMLAKDFVVKIGDFGRAVNVNDLAVGIHIQEDDLPVRWCSPEVLQTQHFSGASDVFAFGTVMHEIFSYGKVVYPGKSNTEVQAMITNKQHPCQPLDCPDALYTISLQCWSYKPSNRPCFAELVGCLAGVEKRLRMGAEDHDLVCSVRLRQRDRPADRIAKAVSAFKREKNLSSTSRQSVASHADLLRRASSTVLFDGGYVLLDSFAGGADQYIVLDPDGDDQDAAEALQDKNLTMNDVELSGNVVLRTDHENQPRYLMLDMTPEIALSMSHQPRSASKALLELWGVDEI